MNCNLRYHAKENSGIGRVSESVKASKAGRWERRAAVFFTVALMSACSWMISTLWSRDWINVPSS